MLNASDYTIFFILFFMLVPAVTLAQDDALRQEVTVVAEGVPMRMVMSDIEHQTGLSFAYRSRLLDEDEPVTLNYKNVPLEEVLEALFGGRSLVFRLVERQIILNRQPGQGKDPAGDQSDREEAGPNSYTINGYVKDGATGEVLIGASVAVRGSSSGAITNKYGFFSLTLNEPADSLSCSFVGYRARSVALSGRDQYVEFGLQERSMEIREVVVYSDESVDEIRTKRGSEDRLRPEAVQQMPALFGEKDVIKSLAAIPGVKFFGDGSTIFYVRGGSRDQNLVTIDEAPIYNPTHLLGFFSTVVPDAVKDIQVYKGDFPANYGGRLSSLVDIRTKDGNMQQVGLNGSVGLLSSRLSLEGPIWKDHISYFVSGRRSYIYKPIHQVAEELKDLHFADLHLKLNYRINENNRVFLAHYSGRDNFEQGNTVARTSGINWQNATTTLRWNHLFSDRLFSNTTLYGSRYDYYLNTNIQQGDYWYSHIDNFSLKTDFTWYLAPGNTLRFGARLAEHFFNPGNFYDDHEILPLPYVISTRRARESALYLSDQWILSDYLSLRMGLRLTGWSNIGEAVEYSFDDNQLDSTHYKPGEVYHTYVRLDPRMSAVFKASERDVLTLSFSRTHQFEHLITNSISPFTTLEVWLPSGPQIRPQRADQLGLGYHRSFRVNGLEFKTEVYHKWMANQIDYRDHARMLMNPFVEYELRFGSGRAYGWETMIKKKRGALTGWLSYTLSRSVYRIPGINAGEAYPSYSDRPHDVSLFLAWQFLPRVSISANFTYMTGAPFTSPTGFYLYDQYQVPVYDARNNDRLPDYHRLDVALKWQLNKRESRFRHNLTLSFYNLYGRKNPVAIHFNKIENADGNLVVPYNYYARPDLLPTQFYLYKMIPSLSYQFGF